MVLSFGVKTDPANLRKISLCRVISPRPGRGRDLTHLVFLLRGYLERIGTAGDRLCTHRELPIVRYLPIVHRISGYGYSARRSDVAGIGRVRSSKPGKTGRPVASGYYAAAGKPVSGCGPAGRTKKRRPLSGPS